MKTSLLIIAGVVILLLGSIVLAAGVVQRRRIRTVYDKRIGLDLPGLVELLPDELKQRRYTRFMLSPRMDEHLSVGLVYELPPDQHSVGNPPNVGLVFDVESGRLVEIKKDGVGLGLK